MTEDTHVHVPSPRKPVDPYGLVDAKVMRDETLPQQVKLLYASLAPYADAKTRECFPSLPRLARESGMGLRTVRSALRCGESVGLFDVRPEYASEGQRSSDPSSGNQTSNRVALRDFGRGYLAGHGPGRTMPSSKRAATVAGVGRRDSPDPAASLAAEHDHRSETNRSVTITPRGEHVAAAADSQARGGCQPIQLCLRQPHGFAEMTAGRVAQSLSSVYVAAVEAVGLYATDAGRAALGRETKRLMLAGKSHDEVWSMFATTLDNAVLGKRNAATWLVTDQAPKRAPDMEVRFTMILAAVEDWKRATYGEDEYLTDEESDAMAQMWDKGTVLPLVERTAKVRIEQAQTEAAAEREATGCRGVYAVSCDDCEVDEGRYCRYDGEASTESCHPARFRASGVTPANRSA